MVDWLQYQVFEYNHKVVGIRCDRCIHSTFLKETVFSPPVEKTNLVKRLGSVALFHLGHQESGK